MRSPGTGLLRVLRTAILAGACTGLAWSGHALWADTSVAPEGFLTATVAMAALLARCTRRQLTFGEIFLVLAGAQVLLHLLFLYSAPITPAPLDPHPDAHADTHAAHGGIAAYTPGMLAGHLWAALLASALLAHGETALWTLLGLLRHALPALPLRPARFTIAWPPTAAPKPPVLRPGTGTPRRHRSRAPPETSAPARTDAHPTDEHLRQWPERSQMTHTFPARRGAVLITSLSAALLLGLSSAPAAFAHNTLIDSSPEDGAELDTAPEEVVLTFNADVGEGNNAIVVTGPDGDSYEDGDVEVDGATASVPLQPLETAGEYTIGYRIISADGHPLEEEMAFTLTEEAVPEEPAEEPAQDSAPADGQDPDAEESAPAEDDTAAADPMSMLGPIGAVIGGIAVIALIVIVIVRMRGRSSGSDGA